MAALERSKNVRIDERMEFREVLRQVIHCLRKQLDVPGIAPYNPDELRTWFHNITAEDIRAVWEERNDDDGRG